MSGNWKKDFLKETNINNVFQELYNNSQVYIGDKITFAQFMEFIANKNEKQNLTMSTANKYVTNNFDKLWDVYKKQQQQLPQQQNQLTQQSNDTSEQTNSKEITQEQMVASRRKRRENYVPVNDSNTNNIMREDPTYSYVGPPPIPSSSRRRPVPSNYDNTIQFNNVPALPYEENNNVYSGIKNISIGGADEASFTPYKSQLDNEPSLTLATDSKYIESKTDGNVSFAGPSRMLARAQQEFIVVLDSRLRDISISPNSNNYRMQLNQLLGRQFGFIRDIQGGLPNILSIEILQVTIPNIIRDTTLRFSEPYLYVDIAEVTGNIRTPVDSLPRAFAQIYYVNSETIRNTSHLTMVPANTLRSYPPDNPLSKLNAITMRFYNFDGELFDFGTDAPRIIAVTNGNTTTFQTDTPHGMATSDRIYIRGFVTNNPSFDNEVTRPSGWIVAVNSLDTFEIQYNSIGMPAPGAFGFALIARLQNNITLRIKAFTTDLS